MQKIEKTIDELKRLVARYDTLRSLFNQFQKSIEEAGKPTFPVKGIAITTAGGTKTDVRFLDRLYIISFSVADSQGVLEFARVKEAPGNPAPAQIASVRFNGQGVLDIIQPAIEDPMTLKEDSCCLNLLVSWLLQDAPA